MSDVSTSVAHRPLVLSPALVLGLVVAMFVGKAGFELILIENAMPYAAMSFRAAVANTLWYLLLAGLAQGAIFVTLLLVFWPAKRLAIYAAMGAVVTLWGANVIYNYDVIDLCLGLGTTDPLTFFMATPQVCLGAATGAFAGSFLSKV